MPVNDLLNRIVSELCKAERIGVDFSCNKNMYVSPLVLFTNGIHASL